MSTDLLRHGDLQVRPQDDLYRCVNGAFLRHGSIRADREAAGAWHDVDDRVRFDLEHLVGTIGPGNAKGTPAQLVGDFHSSFTDVPRLAAQGDDLLIALIDEASQVATMTELSTRFGLLARHQLDSVLRFGVIADPDEPSRYLPRWTQGGLGLPSREHYQNDDLRQRYRAHVAQMFTMTGQPDPQTQADHVLDLETALAQAQLNTVDAQDVHASTRAIRLSVAASMAPNINWKALLGQLDLAAESNPEMIIAQPAYLQAISRLIMPSRLAAWRAWLAWKVISGLADYATPPLANAHWAFTDLALRGLSAPEPRQARVLGYVEHFLGEAMGQLYVERHYSQTHRIRVAAMMRHIISEYRHTFSRLHWLSPGTRQRAVDKLDHLGFRIGAPRSWHDYSTLDIRPDDLLGNALRAAGHMVESDVDRLMGHSTGEEWQIPPHAVNASYDLARNQLIVPAAVLRPPFFDPDADDAVNYGAIGSIIAHEIGHGFDDRGSRFDGHGRLWEWWRPDDRDNYRRIIAQLTAQLDESGANGSLTVNEALSDLGGLAIAWRAWRRSLGTAGDPEPQDGWTGAQRFFLSHAAIWRRIERPEHTALRALTDPHPAEEIRCNLTVRNLDPFHAAFAVKPRHPMWLRPGLRVNLW